ncbi:MAG: sulfite oxidase-like oxidoreductase [candidate division NC10 bacterium]|nr:sulfite oxidase-like oxidoreductase [candidate division NC10 bacterium]
MAFRPGSKRKETGVAGADRVPPNQRVTRDWPVLHAGRIPRFSEAAWDFRVLGLVAVPLRFTWPEFQALPRVQVVSDVHCVTGWSRLDNRWEGVAARDLLDRAGVKPEARFVIVHAEEGYTTNLPLEVLRDPDVLFADAHDGRPLAPEHGFPLRLVVPKRYFWKSAKWVRGMELVARDQPGFWEVRGYNNNADPWREERYW